MATPGAPASWAWRCRTGPTANVGTVLCPGYQDYIALVNSKGGVEGYKIKVIEVDNEYKVPPAMEAHERFKKEGAILEAIYGTPQTAALNKKLEEDKKKLSWELFHAAQVNDVPRIKELLDRGADVNQRDYDTFQKAVADQTAALAVAKAAVPPLKTEVDKLTSAGPMLVMTEQAKAVTATAMRSRMDLLLGMGWRAGVPVLTVTLVSFTCALGFAYLLL